VATDHNTSLIDAEQQPAGSVIENELPAYRAISKLAVFSVIFGFLAVFSFAHLTFFLFAILAIIVGAAANVSIKRYPDMLTGRGLASAGIAMGLVFGLSAGTIATVQSYVRYRESEKFAKQLATALKSPTAGDAMWWSLYPDMRKDKTPAQVLQETEAAKGRDRMMHEQRNGGLNKLRARLAAGSGGDLHFVKIESAGIDDSRGLEMGLYALAVFDVEGPPTKEFPQREQLAAAFMKARTSGPRYEWWVENYIFPYQASTFVPAEKPVDDGHGHAH
jgi:hypothetical protein